MYYSKFYQLDAREAEIRHRELWREVARIVRVHECYPKKGIDVWGSAELIKGHALANLGYEPDMVDCHCWCCQFDICSVTGAGSDCGKRCLIDWDGESGKDGTGCCSKGSAYKRFLYADNYEEAYEAAIDVSNLPIKEMYEDEEN